MGKSEGGLNRPSPHPPTPLLNSVQLLSPVLRWICCSHPHKELGKPVHFLFLLTLQTSTLTQDSALYLRAQRALIRPQELVGVKIEYQRVNTIAVSKDKLKNTLGTLQTSPSSVKLNQSCKIVTVRWNIFWNRAFHEYFHASKWSSVLWFLDLLCISCHAADEIILANWNNWL